MNARTVIVHRVARLGVEAVRVLSLAAVIGRDFDLPTLAAASGRSEDVVLDVLDTAIAAALVVNAAGDDFSFAHALVGHALSDALAPARRVWAHRRIARAIEGICGPSPAARIPRARLSLRRGVRVVVRRHGPPESHRVPRALRAMLLSRTSLPTRRCAGSDKRLLSLQRVPDAEPSLRCTLLVDIGDAQRQAGDPGFRDTLLAAGRCAQELGETGTLIAAALATSRGVFSTTGLVDDEPFALIEAAAEAAGTSDTTAPRSASQPSGPRTRNQRQLPRPEKAGRRGARHLPPTRRPCHPARCARALVRRDPCARQPRRPPVHDSGGRTAGAQPPRSCGSLLGSVPTNVCRDRIGRHHRSSALSTGGRCPRRPARSADHALADHAPQSVVRPARRRRRSGGDTRQGSPPAGRTCPASRTPPLSTPSSSTASGGTKAAARRSSTCSRSSPTTFLCRSSVRRRHASTTTSAGTPRRKTSWLSRRTTASRTLSTGRGWPS